ncbi:hypothetical protein CLOSTHATH_04573 [Hungatella hathewayi DSM 13479]|uniref:Uncharacterized protein n=1 Tax=Hungatella hathewayi DSM 13479 TaxID=566550 RepID=D3ALS7_9FIRM|nr:hypothetical protein CLOSTHATH_04573 [Hungatella hathewayi DSM 13479]
MFGWLKRMRCKHNYCKHWKRSHGLYGGYVARCPKCGKETNR